MTERRIVQVNHKKKERERETDRQTDRQRERERVPEGQGTRPPGYSPVCARWPWQTEQYNTSERISQLNKQGNVLVKRCEVWIMNSKRKCTEKIGR